MKNIPIKEMTIEQLRVELQDARNANALLSRLSPAAGPWIKVSEKLPENGTVCLYMIKGGLIPASGVFEDGEFDDDWTIKKPDKVTHWAEILPPVEENLNKE